MEFDTNWDLEKYHYHYELPHHWDLKKKFITFHKSRFPEDRLICLAQIFCNVHFLGCRYRDDIMELIDELTQGLTGRNEKFDSRSFALASDAVEAKVKAFTGQGQSTNTGTVRRTTEPIAFVRPSEPDRPGASGSNEVVDLTESPPNRKRPPDGSSVNGSNPKVSRFYYDDNPSQQFRQQNQNYNNSRNQNYNQQQNQNYNPQHSQNYNQQKNQNYNQQQSQYSVHPSYQYNSQPNQHYGQQQSQRFNQQNDQAYQNQGQKQQNRMFSFESRRATAVVKDVVESGPFGKVVVFKNARHDDGVINIIERAANAAHMMMSYTYDKVGPDNDSSVTCKFCLDGMYVADGKGKNQRLAKEAACKLALERLRETSFTIEVKERFIGGENPVGRDFDSNTESQSKASVDVPLAENNIGSKMLKMMGWTGGGLGREEQGIEEPIKPYDQNIRRRGLGITNFSDFRKKVSRIIEDYAHSDDKNDLVFSPDFTKDERKTIHELVRKFNLKSRSFGKNEDNRHIVVFRKISPLEIVEELLICGGETQKYKLISPEPKIK